MTARATVKPKADRDLDDHAGYLASEANLEVALRFLVAAHETFALLATHPNIGWSSRLKHAALKPLRVFRVRGFERMLILYRPHTGGVDILRVDGSQNLQALVRRREELEWLSSAPLTFMAPRCDRLLPVAILRRRHFVRRHVL